MSTGLTGAANAQSTPVALVVDDEAPVRGVVARWLADEGFACVQAADAEEALELLRANGVQLAILDIRIPGRSGLELLREIKDRYPDTAALMLTGVGETSSAIEALTLGASGYLIKPVDREDLLGHARRALQRRQLLIENRQHLRDLEQKVREQTLAIRRAHEETIHRLVAASLCRDEETGAHIRRTGLASQLLAEAAGWSAPEAERIRLAAPMHDIGKIGIPDAIIRKPGRLTPQELEVMKRHTIIGAELLARSESPILQMARQIALSHHERWDGRGYPQGLSGLAIPESARIVAIVDVYDALTHDRVYRPALEDSEALEAMRRGSRTQFDPWLLEAFLGVLPQVRRIAEQIADEPLARTPTPFDCLWQRDAPSAQTLPVSNP
ncbi:MAG: HD-GYP domain-containing protein [Thermoguttaceae bacterium]